MPIRATPDRFDAARALGVAASLAVLCAACDGPKPRGFNDFVNDRIARDGTLARCNQDRDATLRDIECANARRAAAAVAVRAEQARREQLELESERKRAALRDSVARQQQLEQEAAAAAEAAAQAAYEAQWVDPNDAAASPTASAGAALQSRAEIPSPAAAVPMVAPNGALPAAAAARDTNVDSDRLPRAHDLPDLDGSRLSAIELPSGIARLDDDGDFVPVLKQLSIPRPFRRPDPAGEPPSQ
jgi:hypothetical protein